MPPETYERTAVRLTVEPAQGEPAPEYRGRRRRPPEVEPSNPEPDQPAPADGAEPAAGPPAAEQQATWPVEPIGFEQWARSLLGEQWRASVKVQNITDVRDGFIEEFVPEPEPVCLTVAAPRFTTRAEAKTAVVGRPAGAGTSSRRSAAGNARRAPQRRLIEPSAQPVGVRRYRGLTAAAALATVGAIGGAGLLVDAALGNNDPGGQAAMSMDDSPVTQAAALRGTEQALGAARGATAQTAPTAPLAASGPSAGQQMPRMTANVRALRMVAVSRAQERGPISGCSGRPPAQEFSNGQIPSSALCALPFAAGHKLRADAAVRLIRLNEMYRGVFGKNLCLTDSYRSLSSQYSVAARKPGLAARPGTSEHGWGLAIDMCDGPDVPGSARRAWMLKHAPEFGWDNPDWARPGTGSKPEPWHWEFIEGEK